MVAVDAATDESVWQRPLAPIGAPDPGVVEFVPIPLNDRIMVPISGTEDDILGRLFDVSQVDDATVYTSLSELEFLSLSEQNRKGQNKGKSAQTVNQLVDARNLSLRRVSQCNGQHKTLHERLNRISRTSQRVIREISEKNT